MNCVSKSWPKKLFYKIEVSLCYAKLDTMMYFLLAVIMIVALSDCAEVSDDRVDIGCKRG